MAKIYNTVAKAYNAFKKIFRGDFGVESGGYGCVGSSTVISCKEDNLDVGKAFFIKGKTQNKEIYTQNIINEEAYNNKLIDKIDPLYIFHIKTKQCKVNNNNITKIKEKCKATSTNELYISNDKTPGEIITMENGGVELFNYIYIEKNMKSEKDFFRLLYNLSNVLLMIKLMNSAELIHKDLKESNILYDKKGKINVIDFGGITNYNDYFEWKSITIKYVPIDLLIFYEKFLKNDGTVAIDLYILRAKMIIDIIENNERSKSKSKSNTRRNSRGKRINTNNEIIQSSSFKNNKYTYEDFKYEINDLFKIFDSDAQQIKEIEYNSKSKYDVYSFGIIIFNIIYKNAFLEKYKETTTLLYKFVYDCIHPNVNNRLSIDQSLTRYLDIFTLYTTENGGDNTAFNNISIKKLGSLGAEEEKTYAPIMPYINKMKDFETKKKARTYRFWK
jgi:serine/threonine protein kinase